jgi:hypothetical protein
MLCASSWSREQSCFALVLEPVAFAIDADDSRVVKDAVEHRRGEHAGAGEGAIPTSEGEIRSEYHRAAIIATRYDLKEQIGLLAAHRLSDETMADYECRP